MEQLLLRLFNIEPARAGEDLAVRFRLPFSWPAWLVILAFIGAVALFVWLYRRETGEARRGLRLLLAFLRVSAFGVLLLMLFELEFVVDRRGLPYLVVCVDDSQSMSLGDVYADAEARRKATRWAEVGRNPESTERPQRLAVARGILLEDNAARLRELVRNYRLRLYRVSASAELLTEVTTEAEVSAVADALSSVEPRGASTRLGDTVRSILSELGGVPPAAFVVFTDGVITEGTPWDEAANLARQKGVPLYLVGIGDPEAPLDLELRDLVADEVAFVGDSLRFEARLVARGLKSPEKVRVELHRQGDPLPVAAEEVDVSAPDRPVQVELEHEPGREGETVYVMKAVPVQGERDVTNNELRHRVLVRDQKLRVLLVDTFPRLEFRFLKHYLERDRTVELRTLLLAQDPQHPEQDRTAVPAFPLSPEELNEYDALIIGDVSPLYFQPSQVENIARFVLDQAGGLILIAGRNYMPVRWRDTPLDPIIPFVLDDVTVMPGERAPFRLRITPEGMGLPLFRFARTEQENRSIWAALPGHYWYCRAPKLKPGAIPLAVHAAEEGDDGPLPLIALQYAGTGKVLMLMIDSTWRWRDRARDRYFGRFWVQSLRYVTRSRLLGQSRQVELTVDRARYTLGQPVLVRVRVLDDNVLELAHEGAVVTIESADQPPVRLTLDRVSSDPTGRRFEARWTPPAEGDYTVTLAVPPVQGEPPSARLSVVAAPDEFRRVEMAADEMRRAAETSRGAFFTVANAEELLQSLPGGRKVPLEVEPPISLWDRWPALILFVGLLTLEWVLRKRTKML